MDFIADINYTFRMLIKKPLFAVVAIMVMAVGLGLSGYTYSLLNTLLYKPLDIKEAESLVAITGRFNREYLFVQSIDAYVAQQLREGSSSFSDFSVYHRDGGTALISGRNSDFTARKFNSSFTEWRLFEIAAVAPFMGRVLQPSDHVDGAEPVIVLSYLVWKNYFSSDPNIIDRIILVDAVSTRVVGVMPEGFAFPAYAQTWQPLRQVLLQPQGHNQEGFLNIIARLKPGVSIDQANADVSVTIKRLQAEYPKFVDNINAFVKPYKQQGLEKQMPLLISMAVIVGLILVLACLNVGNLLLLRINERFKEISVRVALGIPRYRLMMQMLWESVIICTLGGGLAILLSAWGLELTNDIISETYSVKNERPYWWQLGLDTDTVIALVVIIAFTILVTSIIPVWRAISGDFNAVLRDGTRGALSKRSIYFSNVLVIGEILLSCVVLIIASLVMTMAIKASRTDYGVDANNTLVGLMELPLATYRHEFVEKRLQFYDRLRYEMEKEPNIDHLMSMSTVPGSGGGWQYIEVQGQEYPTMESRPKAYSVAVLNGSIKAFDITLLEGRYFDDRDTAGNEQSAIISQSLARELFPNESAIGQRIRFHTIEIDDQANFWYTVVGVVKDVIYGSVIDSSNTVKTFYNSNHQIGIGTRFAVSIRFNGSEKLAKQSIKNALKRVDPDVPIYNLNSYEGLLAQPLFLINNLSKLFVICGLMAVFLAATGIYAVISNSVAMRKQEIGLRRAVGASDNDILSLFIKRSGLQLVIGVGLGIFAAIGLTVVMTDFMAVHMIAYLIGFIVIPLSIIVTVLLATYLPAKSAIILEPGVALHYD